MDPRSNERSRFDETYSSSRRVHGNIGRRVRDWLVGLIRHRGPVFAEEAKLLVEKSRDAAAARQPILTYLAVIKHEKLAEQELRAVRRLKVVDQTFFATVESILAESQLAEMPRIRSLRNRQYCIVYREYCTNAGALIDLSEAVESLHLDDGALEAIEPARKEYESVVIPMVTKLDHAFQEIRIKGDSLDAQAAQTSLDHRSSTALFQQSVHDVRTELRLDVARLQSKISALNRQFLDRFCALLPQQTGSLFRNDYLQSVYPWAYPDACDASALLQSMMAAQTADSSERAALQTIYDNFQAAHKSLSVKMEDRCNA